jgi:hypothetical protein
LFGVLAGVLLGVIFDLGGFVSITGSFHEGKTNLHGPKQVESCE